MGAGVVTMSNLPKKTEYQTRLLYPAILEISSEETVY